MTTTSTMSTTRTTLPTTSVPEVVNVDTEVVGFHEIKVVKSIKPRERKSNGVDHIYPGLAAICIPCALAKLLAHR